VRRAFLIFVSLGALAAPLAAGESASLQAYMAIKQDPGLYVGEGTATDKEFNGDHEKALAAARERARGSLADAISVHVHSESGEQISSEGSSVHESLQSQTLSRADLDLDNVKLMELESIPDPGEVTVMASLGKEDYRRQLAGKKVSVFLPERGLRVKTTLDNPDWLSGRFNPGLNLGMELFFGQVMVGGEWEQDQLPAPNVNYQNTNSPQPTGGYNGMGGVNLTRFGMETGYNWTPWAQRWQPFFPLRLHYEWDSAGGHDADLFGVGGGLGLRYWPADSFALEIEARGVLGLNTVKMNLFPSYDSQPEANLTGIQFDLGLLWSGF
jgi:hypothetical protein